MKKLLRSILSITIIWFIWYSFCLWNLFWDGRTSTTSDFPYQDHNVDKLDCGDDYTNLWDCTSIKEDTSGDDTIIRRLLAQFWLDYSKDRDLKFIDYLKAVMNMALWLLSMIALVMTIYTFYMMFFSENSAGIKKAKWNLIGIFIALGIIWLAWLIVSFIFWRYESNWKDKESIIPEQKITYNVNSLDNQIYLPI